MLLIESMASLRTSAHEANSGVGVAHCIKARILPEKFALRICKGNFPGIKILSRYHGLLKSTLAHKKIIKSSST